MHDLGRKEFITGNINRVAGAQQNMVHTAAATVIQRDTELVASSRCREHMPASCDVYFTDTRDQPSGGGRPYRTLGCFLLCRWRKATEPIGPADELTQEGRSNVGPVIQNTAQRIVLVVKQSATPQPPNR